MRSNGLTAAGYTPVADVDPRLADGLLGELRERAIAAYAEPVATSSMSGLSGPEFVTGVRERLYVDVAHADQVKELIRDRDRALVDETNDDLSWARIVAEFDQPVGADQRSWPADEDLREADPVADPVADAVADAGARSGDTGARSRDVDPADPTTGRLDEGHYVPPPPPPLPQLDPVNQVAWVGLVGGPLLLVIAVLFSIALPQFLSLLAVAGFVAGFITLVARMKDPPDDDRDPDQGAVI